MASVRITIKTDGAAFHEGTCEAWAAGNEVARILRKLADRFGWCPDPSLPYDGNGNVCGKVEVVADQTEREETEERASRMNLRIALRRLVNAADMLPQEAFDTTVDLRPAWIHAGQVLEQERG